MRQGNLGGLTLFPNQIRGGNFNKDEFTFNSNVYIGTNESNYKLKIYGNAEISNNLDINNINTNTITINSNLIVNTCEFNGSCYFKNNAVTFNQLNCLNNITSKTPTWCPYCVNKTEQKLYDNIILNYPNLLQQYKVEWCKNKNYLPFDFVIPEYNIIIELDGLQHFEQVSNWKSPEENLITDKYKMKCANNNNYSIIRILQEDLFYDKYDWYNELIQNIEKIKNEEIIQNIYMCKNNEYVNFET